jgi:hypothetical protein
VVVGADHAGQQPALAADPRQAEPHDDAGVGGHDSPDRGRGPGAGPAGFLVGPAPPRPRHELGDQADDQLPGTAVELAGPEGRQGGQGESIDRAREQ